MFKDSSVYKSKDLTNINKRNNKKNYFNPYEYNLESNLKDKDNMDILCQKSISHSERNILRK